LAAVHRRGFDVDIVRVDAHLGYYNDRSVLRRLHEDVIGPALAAGPRPVWLAGISLGGFGALLYNVRYPGEIAGIVALGPYLGEDEVVDEIARAGSLRDWHPPALAPLDDDTPFITAQRHVWRWLAARSTDLQPGQVPVFLGFGEQDRFVAAQRLATQALPSNRVVMAPGGHDWDAWRPAWDWMLDRMPWPREDACRPSS
jgi:pimeloyl-ACP methyl ester carboxylesterase